MYASRQNSDARIKFPVKKEKILEVMLYLTSKGLDLTTYRLVKLIYLSDREHLRRFGRPISFDKFVAMEDGPVASHAYNVMKQDKRCGVDFDKLPFSIIKRGSLYFAEAPIRPVNKKLFSKSDFMVLDEVVKKYGDWTFTQLWNETHNHYAFDSVWKNHKTKADPMRFEDFFEGIADAESRIADLEAVASNI